MVRKTRFMVGRIKIIIPKLLGSNNPKEDNIDFLYEGKLWRTSRADIAQGVCTKSSMMK
jgi:hypothetical protein